MAVLCSVQSGRANVVARRRRCSILVDQCFWYVQRWIDGIATTLTASRSGPPVTGSFFIHFNLHGAPPAMYALAYGVSSLMLNLTATGLIAGRLLVYRYHLVSQLGRGHGQHYVSIAAVVVESAALYTGFLVVVIVAYAVGSPATNILQQVIEQVQVSGHAGTWCVSWELRCFSLLLSLVVVVVDNRRSHRSSSFCGSLTGKDGPRRPRPS